MANRIAASLLVCLPCLGAAWSTPRIDATSIQNQTIQQRTGIQLYEVGEVNLEGDIFTATGGVHVKVGEWEIRSESVVGNVRTQEFELRGQALALTEDLRLDADLIELNLDSDTFRFERGRAVLGPGLTQGQTRDDLYIYAVAGGGTRYQYELVDGYVTTCPEDNEQYRIRAQNARIWPGDRMALRDVKLEILGKRVVAVPALVIPLRPGAERYVPSVGQSPDEGFFVKTRFSAWAGENSYIDTLVDAFTKLGIGVGAQYVYDHAVSQGEIRAYSLFGTRPSQTLQANHQQRFGDETLTFNARFEQDNYLTAPGNSIYNAIAQYVIPNGSGQTRIGYTLYGSDRTGFRSLNQSFTFADSRRFDTGGSPIRTSFDVNYNVADSSSQSGFSADSQRVDVRMNAGTSLGSFDADLLYRRSIPVTGQEGFLSASDRTPMLTLSSDSERLFGRDFERFLPFQTSLSWGELANPSQGDQIQRVFFEWSFNRTDGESGRSGRLSWGGGFRQGMYSDDTAQYILDASARYTVDIWKAVTANLNYRYLKPRGFTPLSIDRTGRNNAFNFDFTYEPNQQFRMSARSGYDILRSERGQVPWQLVFVDSRWQPKEDFSLTAFTTYDTFNHVWATSRLNANWNAWGAQLSAGIRYDGRREQLAGASLILQGLQLGNLRLSALLDYNGYTSRLDAQHYQLAYDMGCTEAVLELIENNVGFRSGRQIAFFIRIKALPAGGPFGIGQRGQAIGSLPGGFGY